jgi:pyruvate formate lyase activating enzyme
VADPIEKKPLYHFRPGTSILSAGFAGCNLRCPFCQNWHLSQIPGTGHAAPQSAGIPGRRLSPEELIAVVKEATFQEGASRKGTSQEGTSQIAYTYSEPLVHAEYLLDCMRLARKGGIANVLVTNGCVNSEAAKEILSLTDAANIDLKCFSPETYRSLLGGNLKTVLDFITLAVETGVHTEITTLVVPGLNDGEGELEDCAAFIAGLVRDRGGLGAVPWHLSAYHPDYRWKAPPTEGRRLREAARRAKKRLRHVYTGNLMGETGDTLCPDCGRPLITRRAYRIDTGGLETAERDGKTFYRCAFCKNPAPVAGAGFTI